MTLKLEVGKYYRSRNREKVGPVARTPLDYGPAKECPFCILFDNGGVKMSWGYDGRWHGNGGIPNSDDLIEEWKDEESKIEVYEVDLSGFKDEHDPVNHPQHYTSHPSGIECIQITRHMGFNLGNAMKYIWRADLKNGLEDLEKAKWYIQDEIDKRKAQS